MSETPMERASPSSRARSRPAQADLLHAEAAQALFRLGDWVIPPRMELRGDEHLVTRHATVAERTADALLITVRLRRVNVPIPGIERPAHGVDALTPVRHLPDAKAEHGHPVPVCQQAHSAIGCGCVHAHQHLGPQRG
jgi:hypothetical protein